MDHYLDLFRFNSPQYILKELLSIKIDSTRTLATEDQASWICQRSMTPIQISPAQASISIKMILFKIQTSWMR